MPVVGQIMVVQTREGFGVVDGVHNFANDCKIFFEKNVQNYNSTDLRITDV